MKIRRLRMHNFMPYKGDHEIELDVSGGQNVVVIYGDNMRGKTSILNAIRWCLYGKALGRHLRIIPSINLLNREAVRERDWKMSVELSFESAGKTYLLKRSLDRQALIDTPTIDDHLDQSTSLLVDGKAVRADLILDEISQVMPEDISRFFLFDGELLQEYEQLVQDKNEQADRIRREIENALGVPALIHTRQDLAVLLSRFQKKLAKLGSHDKRTKAQSAKLEEFQERKAVLDKELDDLHTLENEIRVQVQDLEDELQQVQRAESVQSELDSVRRRIDQVQKEQQDLEAERLSAVSGVWIDLVSPLVEARTLELRENREQAAREYESHIEQALEVSKLEEAIGDGSCSTCNQPLPRETLGNLRQKLERMKGVYLESGRATARLSRIETSLDDLPKLAPNNSSKDLRRIDGRLANIEVELIRLEGDESDLIGQVGDADVERIRQNRERYARLNRELGRTRSDIQRIEEEAASFERKINALATSIAATPTGATAAASHRVSIVQSLYDTCSQAIEILINNLRNAVEAAATRAFNALTTDPTYSGLRINEQYGLLMLDADGDVVEERSSGAEQVVALALIDGLNKVAGKAGPVIMDTPFGRLDPRHRENVLKYLPDMASQVVLLVHEGELDKERDLIHIADRIASGLEIKRISSSHSKIVRA